MVIVFCFHLLFSFFSSPLGRYNPVPALLAPICIHYKPLFVEQFKGCRAGCSILVGLKLPNSWRAMAQSPGTPVRLFLSRPFLRKWKNWRPSLTPFLLRNVGLCGPLAPIYRKASSRIIRVSADIAVFVFGGSNGLPVWKRIRWCQRPRYSIGENAVGGFLGSCLWVLHWLVVDLEMVRVGVSSPAYFRRRVSCRRYFLLSFCLFFGEPHHH